MLGASKNLIAKLQTGIADIILKKSQSSGYIISKDLYDRCLKFSIPLLM